MQVPVELTLRLAWIWVFNVHLPNGNDLAVGFRALDIDYGDSSRIVPMDLDVTFSGLTIGYTFDL